jgi:hypothetical protein
MHIHEMNENTPSKFFNMARKKRILTAIHTYIFLFNSAKTALECVLGVLSLETARLEREADHSLPVTKLRVYLVPPLVALQRKRYRDSFLFVFSYRMQQILRS